MCRQCDYSARLKVHRLAATRNRLRVLEVIISHNFLLDTQRIERSFAGLIENVEVCVDGVCQTCLQTENCTVP